MRGDAAARKAAAGLAQQRMAAAVVKGGVVACGDTVTRGSTTFVCIRPRHEGPQPTVDQWRRTHGQTPQTDRHYYRAVPA